MKQENKNAETAAQKLEIALVEVINLRKKKSKKKEKVVDQQKVEVIAKK